MRFTAMSVNLWNTQRWPAREAPLRTLLARSPDVLCVQELRPELAATITEVLPQHRRGAGDERAWTHEGNVWWDEARFAHVAHGAAPSGRSSGTGGCCGCGSPTAPAASSSSSPPCT